MSCVIEYEKIILQHIQAGDLRAAQEIFASWTPQEPNEKFRHLFCTAKLHLYQGAYLKALGPLQAYHSHRPEDLDVLCDLALCYYQLGIQAELDLILQSGLSALKEQAASLSSQKLVDAAIFLAKLFEERGEHDHAKELLSFAHGFKLTPNQKQTLRIQLLRISVELRDHKGAQTLYSQVIGGMDHSHNFEIEREHCLLIADAFFFGFPQAVERFEYALSKNLAIPDMLFLNSEMAEQAILTQNFGFLAKLSLSEETESSYERSQAQLINQYIAGHQDVNLSVIRLEKSLTIMSLLRILRQALLLFPHSSQYEQWSKRYQFHILSLSSRSLRANYLASLRVSKGDTILVCSSKKIVTYNGKEQVLKSSLFWALLKMFCQGQTEVPIEEVIRAVYQETPNPQHFDRLRIGISRLNAGLKSYFHIEALFKISKNKITLLLPMKEEVL